VVKPLYRLAVILGLALALLGAQQAAAWHDLGHLTGSHKQDSKPGSSQCKLCFACAELSGAVGMTFPRVPPGDAAHIQFATSLDPGVALAPCLAFRSRAPPTLL
jgi:hypothetical protein